LVCRGRLTFHPSVHRQVGQPVRVTIFLAQYMIDLKGIQFANHPPGLAVQLFQGGMVDLVVPVDLLHHQL